MSTTINPQDYAHSPLHYAVATFNHATLTKLLSALPKPPDPTQKPESNSKDSLVLDKISAALDRRDNPLKETPLHLAVRLNSTAAATAIAAAGADISLQNAAGWNPLQEAILRRRPEIVAPLVRRHHSAAWAKWVRRRPVIAAALRRMRDFYMEISFHFESSIVPFVGKIAPSDTYRIWKRDGNLRADMSLAGYDGLKVQRVNQTFLFLNDVCDDDDGGENEFVKEGCLLILNHDEKRIYDAFEMAGKPLSDSDIAVFLNQTSVYRPGVDVTKAELVSRTNWRKQEKFENVGIWKARVYDMHNVTCNFRTRKLNGNENRDDPFSPTCVLPLEIDEESDEAFIVAENPRYSVSDRGRRHSSFVREEREFVTVSRKSVDIFPVSRATSREVMVPVTKEKDFTKGLRPAVWLTEQFPLKTDELLPLLDILADKVKAVRRVREVLTTKFPAGTFPVKVAIPVVPTVRVVITFTKFVELPPVENFYTPVTSPRQLASKRGNEDGSATASGGSSGYFSWLKSGSSSQKQSDGSGSEKGRVEDPFRIPVDYVCSSFDEKNRKVNKSRSTKRTK